MTEAEIDEFCERCNHRVGRNPARCQEGASRGGFTLGFPKVWLKPAEGGFRRSHAKQNVRFGSLADIETGVRYVCFAPKSGSAAGEQNVR
jgi:hypothetical protein